MIRGRVNENIARSWCAKMLQTGQFERKRLICGCLSNNSHCHCSRGTLYTSHWLCYIWVISKFYGWYPHGPWLPCPSSTQHRLQIHMLKKIQCRWPLLWLFKTSAGEGVSRLMEGRWQRVETHFQRTHLSWCADFAGNDLICKTTNVRDKMVRIIKQIETLCFCWLTFYCYCIYQYVSLESRLHNVWKQRLEERLLGPFTSGVFLQHHTWI